MPTTTKSKPAKKIRIRSGKRIKALLFVVLVAVVGVYFLTFSKADTYAWLRSFNSISLAQGGERFSRYTAGQEFKIPLYTNGMFSNRQNSGGPVQLVLSIGLEPNHVKYLGYDCNYPTPCRSDKSFGGSVWGKPWGNVKDLICLDMPDGANNSRINLVTLHIKALQNLSGDSQEQWSIFGWGFAKGTCTTNTNAKDVQWHSALGNCGGNIGTYDCSQGLSFGSGPLNTSQGQKGQTTKDTGSKGTGKGSGGGGGSTSSSRGTKSTQPTASTQGVTKQPVLKPSPFYDGIEYAAGSDPIDKNLGNISVAGRKIAHGWVYLALLATTIVGGVGYYWWQKRQA